MKCSFPSLRGQKRHPSKRAFTLVELLVALAVLSVFAALIFKAGMAGQKKAASAKCVGNLRFLGNTVFAYTAENNGQLPQGFQGSGSPEWFRTLAPYAHVPENLRLGIDIYPCPTKNTVGTEYSVYGANYPHVFALNPGQTGSSWMETGVRRLGTVDGRAFMLADAWNAFVYTPLLWTLTKDQDGDGVADSNHNKYAGLDFRHDGKGNFLLLNGSIIQLTPREWAKNENNVWGKEIYP